MQAKSTSFRIIHNLWNTLDKVRKLSQNDLFQLSLFFFLPYEKPFALKYNIDIFSFFIRIQDVPQKYE